MTNVEHVSLFAYLERYCNLKTLKNNEYQAVFIILLSTIQ